MKKPINKPAIKIFSKTIESIHDQINLEHDINKFIESDEVDSLIDIKTNIEIQEHGFYGYESFSNAKNNKLIYLYTVIYIPAETK